MVRIVRVIARKHTVHRAPPVRPLYQSTISLPGKRDQTSPVIELREHAPGESRRSDIAVRRLTTRR